MTDIVSSPSPLENKDLTHPSSPNVPKLSNNPLQKSPSGRKLQRSESDKGDDSARKVSFSAESPPSVRGLVKRQPTMYNKAPRRDTKEEDEDDDEELSKSVSFNTNNYGHGLVQRQSTMFVPNEGVDPSDDENSSSRRVSFSSETPSSSRGVVKRQATMYIKGKSKDDKENNILEDPSSPLSKQDADLSSPKKPKAVCFDGPGSPTKVSYKEAEFDSGDEDSRRVSFSSGSSSATRGLVKRQPTMYNKMKPKPDEIIESPNSSFQFGSKDENNGSYRDLKNSSPANNYTSEDSSRRVSFSAETPRSQRGLVKRQPTMYSKMKTKDEGDLSEFGKETDDSGIEAIIEDGDGPSSPTSPKDNSKVSFNVDKDPLKQSYNDSLVKRQATAYVDPVSSNDDSPHKDGSRVSFHGADDEMRQSYSEGLVKRQPTSYVADIDPFGDIEEENTSKENNNYTDAIPTHSDGDSESEDEKKNKKKKTPKPPPKANYIQERSVSFDVTGEGRGFVKRQPTLYQLKSNFKVDEEENADTVETPSLNHLILLDFVQTYETRERKLITDMARENWVNVVTVWCSCCPSTPTEKEWLRRSLLDEDPPNWPKPSSALMSLNSMESAERVRLIGDERAAWNWMSQLSRMVQQAAEIPATTSNISYGKYNSHPSASTSPRFGSGSDFLDKSWFTNHASYPPLFYKQNNANTPPSKSRDSDVRTSQNMKNPSSARPTIQKSPIVEDRRRSLLGLGTPSPFSPDGLNQLPNLKPSNLGPALRPPSPSHHPLQALPARSWANTPNISQMSSASAPEIKPWINNI